MAFFTNEPTTRLPPTDPRFHVGQKIILLRLGPHQGEEFLVSDVYDAPGLGTVVEISFLDDRGIYARADGSTLDLLHVPRTLGQIMDQGRPIGSPPVRAKKPRLSREQKAALESYRRAMQEENRYMGSVFVNAHGQRTIEAKTRAAYAECLRLGVPGIS